MDPETSKDEQTSNEDLEKQLKTAKQEVQNLTHQLNCLVLLAKKAWQGDEAATAHLARVIGVELTAEENIFVEKQSSRRSSAKKSVKISDDTDEILPKRSQDMSKTSSNENLDQQETFSTTSMSRSSYLQPFFKQSHIDPIRGQSSKTILNNMIRHHQNELRKGPVVVNRNTPTAVRPRATKHLYRPASAEHSVRHLGTPISRNRPFFVFAGREFFQQTTNYSPIYQRAVLTSKATNPKEKQEFLEQSEVLGSLIGQESTTASAPVQPAKTFQQSSNYRLSTRSVTSDIPARSSSALSNASSSKMTQISERERRDTMKLQRQLNLPRQGWVNQEA